MFNEEELKIVKEKALENHIPIIMDDTLEKIEEILKEQKELMAAKKESIQSAKRVEELYTNALNAMRRYSGQGEQNEQEDIY